MSSIDLTTLAASLGDYCRTNQEILLKSVLIENKSFLHMTPMMNVKDEQPILDLPFSDIVKPYTSTWDPTSDIIDVVPRIMKVRPIKAEVQLEPIAYQSTYLGHFIKPGVTPENFPFEKFLMEKIIQKAKEQLELEAIFKGIYNAVGTTPGATMDGLEKIISDEITATKITEVAVGIITSANAIESLETMFDAIPEAWQDHDWKMFVSPEIKRWYDTNYRATYGNVTHNQEFSKQFIDGTKCEIVSMPGMAGQQRIHLSPVWNFFYGMDLERDLTKIDVQRDHWYIDIMMSFNLGVQLGSLDYYFTNDAA